MTRLLSAGFDHVVLDAPFGVMFRDSLHRDVIADGLEVELRDPRRLSRRHRLRANTHGVFVAHALPHLRSAWREVNSPLLTREFQLTVRDSRARYLPLMFNAELPSLGLFQPSCFSASPLEDEPYVPLFSATTRSFATGQGVLRAELRLSSDHDRPASWARLELRLGSTLLAEGLADERGRALLLCPLPEPRDPPLHASPPDSSFERSSWQVTLHAFWDRAHASEEVPELCALQELPHVRLLPESFVLQAWEPLNAHSVGSSFLFVDA